ncbi:hypothetical protein Aph02nite_33960 [Actinoplanes philippinensis]|uniref:Uncharacterized protein n=1 Tax=Actinoplanes philippinensis TaxID=35752 RepID=A0A1I2DWI2_9ACTN|nr:hypothetical protein [Actinoplanes philippinensis]GIE77446.1 hypothetical protein Aph02nite_33960 [Actinoplanes philippinensis]SFE84611.1 hypothetical protein SAMN05421541_1047 [Actinoplanes philippinensis]
MRGDTSVVTGRRVVHLLLVIGFALVAYVLLSFFDRGARADGVVPGSPVPAAAVTTGKVPAAAVTTGKVPAVAKTLPRKTVVPTTSPRNVAVPKVPSREVAVPKVPSRKAVGPSREVAVPKVPADKAAGSKATLPKAALAKPVERTTPAREVVGSVTRLPKAAVPKVVERIVPPREVVALVTSLPATALSEATKLQRWQGDIAGLEGVDPAPVLITSSKTFRPWPPVDLVDSGLRQGAALAHVDRAVGGTGTVPAPHPAMDVVAAVPVAPASCAGPGSWAVPLAASRVPHSHGARSFVPSPTTVTGHGPLTAPDSQAAGAGQFRDAAGGGASPAGTVPSPWRPAAPVATILPLTDVSLTGRSVRYSGPPS